VVRLPTRGNESAQKLGRLASYPQVGAVTLTSIPTHLVADIKLGRYDTNEMVYAKSLLPQIPEDSLTVFDKGFLAEILCGLTMGARNRHFVIPVKSNTCWEVISGTADDATVRMRVSPQARKKCPALPDFRNARAIRTIDARGRERVLLTSLGDRRRFKPADIVACYERRWQIETSYRELKQSMLGSELTLRSRTVEGVYQEIWGALIAYNLIRREIASAACEARTDRYQLRACSAYDPARNDVGRAEPGIREIASLPSASARTAQVVAQ